MYTPYHDQFYIESEQAWRILENNKPLKGYNSTHTIYASGNWVYRKENLPSIEGVAGLKLQEATLYMVCDAYECPVGPLRDKDYAILLKNNIIFPKTLYNNGYLYWEDAQDALRLIREYYQRMLSIKTLKKDTGVFANFKKDVWIPEETQKKRIMSDTLGKKAKRKSPLESLGEPH